MKDTTTALLVIILCLTFGVFFGYMLGRSDTRKEAVANEAGRWVAVDGMRNEFVWGQPR